MMDVPRLNLSIRIGMFSFGYLIGCATEWRSALATLPRLVSPTPNSSPVPRGRRTIREV
jgi:hypothetical protein